MALREEKLLEQYFHELSLEAERIPDSRIHSAIRHAIAGESAQAKKLWKKRLLTATAAAVITVLLLASAGSWMGEGTGLRNALNPFLKTSRLEAYRAISNADTTVNSALEAGLLKQVGISSLEKEGHVLSVDGMVADAMGVIILYSVDNKSGQTTKNHDLSLIDSKGSAIGSELMGMHQEFRSGITLNITRLTWAGDVKNLPEEVEVQLEIAKSAGNDAQPVNAEELIKLSVPIIIDKKAMEAAGQTIMLNQPFRVAGQMIDIKQVYAGVSGIYVETAYNKGNTQDVFGMLNPRMLLGDEAAAEGLYLPKQIQKEGRTFSVFNNDSTKPKAPLRLTTDGIYALEPSRRELIIDTDQQKILKAPDDTLTVNIAETPDQHRVIVLKRHLTNANKKWSRDGNLTLNMTFKDGSGVRHEYDQLPLGMNFNDLLTPKEGEAEVVGYNLYPIGKEKLPQPLIFTLDSYPNAILDAQTIRIR
jgi:hypothetical protein